MVLINVRINVRIKAQPTETKPIDPHVGSTVQFNVHFMRSLVHLLIGAVNNAVIHTLFSICISTRVA